MGLHTWRQGMREKFQKEYRIEVNGFKGMCRPENKGIKLEYVEEKKRIEFSGEWKANWG